MMGIDPVYTSTLIPFLRELLRNWFAVSPVGFDAAGDTVFLPIVATLVLLAGLSEALGTHSVALFGNRVRRQTFYISMLVYAVCFLLGSVVWVGVSWLLAAHVFHIHQSIHVLAVVIGFSYVPRLFACLTLAPYVGPLLAQLLRAWSFLLALTAVAALYHITWEPALLCTAAGWLCAHVLHRFVSHRLVTEHGRLWLAATREVEQNALVIRHVIGAGYRQAQGLIPDATR